MQSSERQRLSATLSGLSQRQIHDDDTAVVITDSPTSSHLVIHESDSDNDDNHSNLNASPLPPLRSIIRYDSLSRAEVASSNMRTGACFSNALAMARR